MAVHYEELRDKLLSWSNRDLEVFGSTTPLQTVSDPSFVNANGDNWSRAEAQLYDFLRYAADKAYRTLRIPPLEKVYRITITADHVLNKCFGIPGDLTEFISISKIGQVQDDGTIIQIPCPVVYNEKVDYRTYRDSLAHKNTAYHWTRQRGNILFDDFGLQIGDVFELYYYGRLPALHALYPADTIVSRPTADDPDATEDISNHEIPNWLRDENERIVLFGGLAEAFSFLGEDDMQAKYLQMFQQEIDELNREETMRTASGGNTQIQYSSGLI